VESFLQIILQLALIAALEDGCGEDQGLTDSPSFIQNALNLGFQDDSAAASSVVKILHRIWLIDEFSACRSKIRHLLRLFNQKHPRDFARATQSLDFPSGRFDTASPANYESELEAKKKQAVERKAKVMAQFQQQQQNFMDKSGFDWDDEELASPDAELPASTEMRMWKYPSGLCIQCREDTTDSRLYGTFAMITDGHILRETPSEDPDFVNELSSMPDDLDRSIDHQRPFGVAGSNREHVSQMTGTGEEIKVERQGLSKGWPLAYTKKGPLTTSCGHIMHFACYENYYQSVYRRHSQQVARNHPERVALKEFVCPLCKALANAFLPIVWKSTDQAYPGSLETQTSFAEFLDMDLQHLRHTSSPDDDSIARQAMHVHRDTLSTFSNSALTPAIEMAQTGDLTLSPTTSAWAERPELAPFTELTSVYLRLKDPLAIIARTTQSTMYPAGSSVNHFSLLLDSLSNTIAAVEVAYRGREAEFGTSLLSAIPQQTLSHLQILSSSVRSYSATCSLTIRGTIEEQYGDVYAVLYRQLFAESLGRDDVDVDLTENITVPLLRTDAFSFLTRATMVLCPLKGVDLRHILRLSLTAELLRVLLHYSLNPTGLLQAASRPPSARSVSPTNTDLHALEQALLWIEGQLALADREDVAHMRQFDTFKTSLDAAGAAVLLNLLRTYALAFMRKTALFFHVAHGVDLPTTAGSEASLPELDRLLHFMQLPSVTEILMEFSEFSPTRRLRSFAAEWISDWGAYGDRNPENQHLPGPHKPAFGIRLLHPAPLELIGLPKYYDVLIELSSRKKCPTTGKELTDPALCLFCGEIFCSQTVCCMTRQHRGGCNAHVEKCSSPIGMFLFVRKCHVVLLHVVKDPKMLEHDRERMGRGMPALPPGSLTLSHGSFFPAPYMTRHGETDSGLRSKQVLMLSQKRYDRLLRDAWLMVNGSVWSGIARKLEGEVNAGGWETL
jgi:E3 ubiquitin-protein ligase UBR1